MNNKNIIIRYIDFNEKYVHPVYGLNTTNLFYAENKTLINPKNKQYTLDELKKQVRLQHKNIKYKDKNNKITEKKVKNFTKSDQNKIFINYNFLETFEKYKYPQIGNLNNLRTKITKEKFSLIIKINFNMIEIDSNYCKLNANKKSGNVRKTACGNIPEFGNYGCTTNKKVCKPINLLRLFKLFNWKQVILYEDNAKFLPSMNNLAINEGYTKFIRLRNSNNFNTYSNPGNVFDGSSIKGQKFIYDNTQKLFDADGNSIRYNKVYEFFYQRRVKITIDKKNIEFDFFVLDNTSTSNVAADDYMVLVKIVDDGNNNKRKVTQILISPPGKTNDNIKRGNHYIKTQKMILHKGLLSPGEKYYKEIIENSQYSETRNEWKFWKVLGDASQVAFCDLLGRSDKNNLHILFTIENENKLPALAKLHNVNVLQRNNRGIYKLYLNENSKKFVKSIDNTVNPNVIMLNAGNSGNSTRSVLKRNSTVTNKMSNKNGVNSNIRITGQKRTRPNNSQPRKFKNKFIEDIESLKSLLGRTYPLRTQGSIVNSLYNNLNKLNKKIKGF